MLNRDDIQAPWKQYTEHAFVQQMGDGTLPVENFKYYMIQDYLFLVQFSRATALSAYKSSSLKDIGRSVQQVVTLQEEIKLHIAFCKEYGLEEADIVAQEEDQGSIARAEPHGETNNVPSNHRLHTVRSRHWSVSRLACAPSCALTLSDRLRDHRKTPTR
jgi:hypothetical protein